MKKQIYIVTGLSGAGKSTALRVFEDLRFFALDGLPPALLPEVVGILDREAMRHFPGMAIGLDLRQDDFLDQFSHSLQKLQEKNLEPKLVFLEADNRDLIRRYAATRRPHPLEIQEPGLEAAITRERGLLRLLRKKADVIINSTGFSIHDLRREILRYASQGEGRSLRVSVISFGFKYGAPQDADFIFDLRFLDNPYFVESLRPLSGRDKEVADFIFANSDAREFKDKALNLLLFCLNKMEEEGRYRVTIAFGCTGGRHRSVAMAEEIARVLKQADFPVNLGHRNLNEDLKN